MKLRSKFLHGILLIITKLFLVTIALDKAIFFFFFFRPKSTKCIDFFLIYP